MGNLYNNGLIIPRKPYCQNNRLYITMYCNDNSNKAKSEQKNKKLAKGRTVRKRGSFYSMKGGEAEENGQA